MIETSIALTDLFDKIPRRHSVDNVKEMNCIFAAYEDLLLLIEAENEFYESNIAVFFNHLEAAKASLKKAIDNKASKKNKDVYFDETAGIIKDSIQELIELYNDGHKTK
jgi:hypothetical protein